MPTPTRTYIRELDLSFFAPYDEKDSETDKAHYSTATYGALASRLAIRLKSLGSTSAPHLEGVRQRLIEELQSLSTRACDAATTLTALEAQKQLDDLRDDVLTWGNSPVAFRIHCCRVRFR